jgi:hypothetical protein
MNDNKNETTPYQSDNSIGEIVLYQPDNSIQLEVRFATTAADGKVYLVEHYSLDMILLIGYRVKSQQGIHFRIWSNLMRTYLFPT